MSTGTGIEWTEATWNTVSGCTRASEGCDNCYAVKLSHRLEAMGQAKYAGLTVLNGRGDRHFNGTVRTNPASLADPLHWKKPRRIFVNSMSDTFHKDVPFEFIDQMFAVMALCPQHTFQVLTKRPERMAEYLALRDRFTGNGRGERVGGLAWSMAGDVNFMGASLHRPKVCFDWPLPNVWLGTSCENQQRANERIPHLLKCPARVRFLSCEPLLGPIDLEAWITKPINPGLAILSKHYGAGGFDPTGSTPPFRRDARGPHDLHWVIVGGESGIGSRPCDVASVRSIVNQCKASGVAVFVKQLGRLPHDDHDACAFWPVPPEGRGFGIVEIDGRTRIAPAMVSPKGGDPAEWPEALRVREMPR